MSETVNVGLSVEGSLDLTLDWQVLDGRGRDIWE